MHDPLVTDPAADTGLERLTAETHTALRTAVHEAAHDAARNPVVARANTTAGQALAEDRQFADALRLRIYLAARDHLARLATSRHGVALRASLPSVPDLGGVRPAIERVHVEPVAEPRRSIEVRIDDIRLRARQNGRVVGETQLDPELVVETPILALHDRVTAFEHRLNAPVGAPGVATRLTAALYPLAWARGYAQFRGAPIENVIANRHVALLTNRALLATQRRHFGVSDPVGRAVYRRTLRETGVTELVRASDSNTVALLDQLARERGIRETSRDTLARLESTGDAPRPADIVTVGVNRTADLAYARSLAVLNETLAATYRPAGRVRAAVRTLDRERLASHDPPPAAGGVLETYTSYDTTVHPRSGSPLPVRDGWHALGNESRRVVVIKRTVKVRSMPGNSTASTVGTVRFERAVDLLVEGNHSVGPAPKRAIPSVHHPGGPLDGPNLADAPDRIRERVVEARGGPDALAARAAIGRLDSSPRRVDADRPDGLAAWTHPDLSALHDHVRQVSVDVPRGDIATFGANVPARLADSIRERRADLIDAPDSYGSVAERARTGVRTAYVDRVVAMLDARAAQYRAGKRRLADDLPSDAADAASLMRDGYVARKHVGSATADSPLPLAVDASPSYLTRRAVGHGTVRAIPDGQTEYPLVVRNVNAFGLPTAGVVDALFGLLDGPATTSLRSAGQVLTAARAADFDRGAPARAVSALQNEVRGPASRIESSLRYVLWRHQLGSASARERVVDAALARWNGLGAQAAALENGSAADAVFAQVLNRWPDAFETATARKRLAMQLDFAVDLATDAELFQPRVATVNQTATLLRGRLGAIDQPDHLDGTQGTADGVERLAARRSAAIAARLPKGVPVVPAPGMWYATVNAWYVHVRGSYARFAVRAPVGAPDRMPPDLTYVREAAPVRLDVDGDRDTETIGTNRRLEFDSRTVVGIAVPPQPQGVGDVTERNEQSRGWPTPGATK